MPRFGWLAPSESDFPLSRKAIQFLVSCSTAPVILAAELMQIPKQIEKIIGL